MIHRQISAIALTFICTTCSSQAQAYVGLNGNISTHTAYFLKPGKLRHNRYELNLNHQADVTPSFKLNSSYRGRVDAVLFAERGRFGDKLAAKGWDFTDTVLDDETSESELRSLYVSYLSDHYALKVGRFPFDWLDSLSPLLAGLLVPLDLRYGGVGSAADIVEPIEGINFNQKLSKFSLDWIFITGPRSNRLPRGYNGYIDGLDPMIVEELGGSKIDSGEKNWEFGVRFLKSIGQLEIASLLFQGHHRNPIVDVNLVSPIGQVLDFEVRYPRLLTAGVAFVYSDAGYVARLLVFNEPNHLYPSQLKFFDSEDYTYNLKKIGVGFDYVLSKHFKLFSEHYYNQIEADSQEFSGSIHQDSNSQIKSSFSSFVSLGNSSIESIDLLVDFSFSGPEKSGILNPKIKASLGKWTIDGGIFAVKSLSQHSLLEAGRNSSRIYVNVSMIFDAARTIGLWESYQTEQEELKNKKKIRRKKRQRKKSRLRMKRRRANRLGRSS